MGWFSKDKKEVYYRYAGIKESEIFRDNLRAFFELNDAFNNSNKVFTKEDLNNITKEVKEVHSNIDVQKHLIWIREQDLESYLEKKIKKESENGIKVSTKNFYNITAIEIDNDNLNLFKFENESDKHKLITHLESLIDECLNIEPSNFLQMPNVIRHFANNFKYRSTDPTKNIWFKKLIIIKQDVFMVNTFNDETVNVTKLKQEVHKEHLKDSDTAKVIDFT